MEILASYLAGAWHPGTGPATSLMNPTTDAPVATVHGHGLDLGGALAFARDRGGAALAALTFAERGERLAAMAKAMHSAREELIALAVANGGNTRGDAKFDLDGASGTLAHYAELAKSLGDRRVIVDGDAIQLGRTARLSGQHAWVPRPGVAVFVNAFNFPAWGLGEKLACAFLAGMPVQEPGVGPQLDHAVGDQRGRGGPTPGSCPRARCSSCADRPAICSITSARSTCSRSPARRAPPARCAATPASSASRCGSTSRPTA